MTVSLKDVGDYELMEEMQYRGLQEEFDLEGFSEDELIYELEARGVFVPDDDLREIVIKIWMKRRLGQDYQVELDRLIYDMIGKVI